MNSDTPRTDAQLRDYGDNPSIFPNFARQLERELAEAREQYQMEKAGADQLRVNCRWLIHQLELFNANKQFVKELAEKDTVPRTRYDACNKDWLEERELRKKVQNDSHNIIVDLEAELAEAKEQLAAKDKQIDEIVVRATKYSYGSPDFKYCKTHKCNGGSCAYCYRHWLKTGEQAEKKAKQ